MVYPILKIVRWWLKSERVSDLIDIGLIFKKVSVHFVPVLIGWHYFKGTFHFEFLQHYLDIHVYDILLILGLR